jgi:hypothetical protein
MDLMIPVTIVRQQQHVRHQSCMPERASETKKNSRAEKAAWTIQ